MNTSAYSLHIRTTNVEKSARPPEIISGLLGIWEASVRASHHFLTEDDIRSLCPLAEEAIRQIETLWVVEEGNVRIGFIGIQSGKIEMLFLHPDYFRRWHREDIDPKGGFRSRCTICRRQRTEPFSREVLRTDGLPHIPPGRHR